LNDAVALIVFFSWVRGQSGLHGLQGTLKTRERKEERRGEGRGERRGKRRERREKREGDSFPLEYFTVPFPSSVSQCRCFVAMPTQRSVCDSIRHHTGRNDPTREPERW
jgi:hypothetical protein